MMYKFTHRSIEAGDILSASLGLSWEPQDSLLNTLSQTK